jgi:hypothetical protein
MLGVPPRRLSRHLSPLISPRRAPVGHPLNVANEAAVTRSEGGIRQRPRWGRGSRRELIRAWRTLGARARGRGSNSARHAFYAGYFSAREKAREETATRINGDPHC